MDLKTSFAFYFASLALYLVVLTSLAFADKRVIGTRWLAYSVLLEIVKLGLQSMAPSIAPVLSSLVANELNLAAFFTMYIGIRWFVRREPLQSRLGPLVLIALMVVYLGMSLLHVAYSFPVGVLGVVWLCGLTVRLLLQQREERFRIPAGISVALLLAMMGLVIYRCTLAVQVYRTGPDWVWPSTNPGWNTSMMLLVFAGNCLLVMYVWFAAAEMHSAVLITVGIDSLTGCLNRRALMKLAEHEVARSQRTGMPLTVVALDLDHFKEVNDTYGHPGGDATLCAVVELLRRRLRSVDVVARTGGEEFVLLLPDTDAVSGTKVVEGLRQAVHAMRVEYEGHAITTALSAGVTQGLTPNDSWTAMINRADRALYAAKAAGRNRVILDEQAARLPRRAVGVRAEEEVGVGAEAHFEGGALRIIRKRLG